MLVVPAPHELIVQPDPCHKHVAIAIISFLAINQAVKFVGCSQNQTIGIRSKGQDMFDQSAKPLDKQTLRAGAEFIPRIAIQPS